MTVSTPQMATGVTSGGLEPSALRSSGLGSSVVASGAIVPSLTDAARVNIARTSTRSTAEPVHPLPSRPAVGAARRSTADSSTSAKPSAKPTIPAHVLPHRTPAQLLALAHQGLVEAARTRPDGLRYAAAHLAALRAAAAVLAARARPEPRRRNQVTSVWVLLAAIAPELGEWAAFFAASASKRAAAEAGIPRAVTTREADDLVRAAAQFVDEVADSLGLAYQQPIEDLVS